MGSVNQQPHWCNASEFSRNLKTLSFSLSLLIGTQQLGRIHKRYTQGRFKWSICANLFLTGDLIASAGDGTEWCAIICVLRLIVLWCRWHGYRMGTHHKSAYNQLWQWPNSRRNAIRERALETSYDIPVKFMSSSDNDSVVLTGSFRCTTMQVYDLAWSPTGEYIIVGSTDNCARIYTANEGQS